MVLLLLMVLPPIRRATEASMTAQMLVQYPGLSLAGGLLVERPSGRGLQALRRCNELGIAGLVGSATAPAVVIVPHVLDLVLIDLRVEGLKMVAFVLAGAALGLSWQRVGTVVQVSLLGNMFPMMALTGTLYQDAPARVCDAYRLGDPQNLGRAQVWIAVGVLTLWLLHLGLQRRDISRKGQKSFPADGSTSVGQGPRSGLNER